MAVSFCFANFKMALVASHDRNIAGFLRNKPTDIRGVSQRSQLAALAGFSLKKRRSRNVARKLHLDMLFAIAQI
jgi:hypothetical protein